MGTPEFATASLKRIIDAGYDVVGVITSPDKPSGRGKKITMSPVKKMGLLHGLKVLQPSNLKSPDFVEEFRLLDANLGVVVAFRMLPEVIWSMPEYGTFNVHASLLPDYRGAAPIHHAIMNGEKETGVTTFFLRHDIDTGDIILREKTEVGKNETAGDLHDKLMMLGADLLIKTLQAIEEDRLRPKKQSDLVSLEKELHLAPKIYKEDCRINWEKPVKEVYNKIRGLSPAPGAFTLLKNPEGQIMQLKIYKSNFAEVSLLTNPGYIETNNKDELLISCMNGKIEIRELQLQGKKKMDIKDFLNGLPISSEWTVK